MHDTPRTLAPYAFAALACLILPWLNPAASGPSAVMQPWLTAAGLTLVLWMLVRPPVTRRAALVCGFAVMAAVAFGAAEPSVLLAAGGILVIAMSAAIARAGADQDRVLAWIARGWLAAALVSSLMALVQYFGLSQQLSPWVNPTIAGEAFANLRQRNQFASLTSIGLLALVWMAQRGARWCWTLPATVLLAAANAASASRTGALQILMILALACCWRGPGSRSTAKLCFVALVTYAIAALLLPLALEQLSGVAAPNVFSRLASSDGCGSRAVLWSNVLHLIAQKPLGWGWGELDFAHFATLYPGPRFCDILDNAHNLPLHIAVELGLPAAILAVAVFVVWLARQRPWRETDATRQLAWSVIAVILLHSLLEYPLWYGPFQMAFGLALGLLLRSRPAQDTRMLGPVETGAVTALLTALLLYSAWDYHRVSQLYTAPQERSFPYRDQPVPRFGTSWFFRDQLAFAELSVTPLTQENAARMNALAMELLHYSPEPRVIDLAIESAMMLHREADALWLLARYRAAFPEDAAQASKARRPASTQPLKD